MGEEEIPGHLELAYGLEGEARMMDVGRVPDWFRAVVAADRKTGRAVSRDVIWCLREMMLDLIAADGASDAREVRILTEHLTALRRHARGRRCWWTSPPTPAIWRPRPGDARPRRPRPRRPPPSPPWWSPRPARWMSCWRGYTRWWGWSG
jgi:hypothetical protein